MSDLTDAIQAGDAAAATALLDADPSLLESAENGVRPLMFALYCGKPELARLFMNRGAPVSFGEACALGGLAQVRELLAAQPALLEERTPDGFTPLTLSIFFRQPAIAAFLIAQGADVDAAARNAQQVAPVHSAAAVCDRESMELLLAHGANVHARQQADYTALHGAASRGDVEMAKLLLRHGADRNAQAADGLTPAETAKKYGHPEFAAWLATVLRRV